MPPGPGFNFFCVLSSAADILAHAARIRAAQAVAQTSANSVAACQRKRQRADSQETEKDESEAALTDVSGERSLKDKTTRRGVELPVDTFPASPSENSAEAVTDLTSPSAAIEPRELITRHFEPVPQVPVSEPSHAHDLSFGKKIPNSSVATAQEVSLIFLKARAVGAKCDKTTR